MPGRISHSLLSMRFRRRTPMVLALLLALFRAGLGVAPGAARTAPIPAPERLLPEDTLAVVSAPNFIQLKAIWNRSPEALLLQDPAMKPFKEKFLARWREEV